MHETAHEAFLFCKDCLEKRGHVNAVRRLEGLAPINTGTMSRLALAAMTDIRPSVQADEDAVEYVDIAINALTRAVGTPSIQQAA